VIGVFGVLGSLIVFPYFEILFVPFTLFFLYSLALIITKRGKKRRDRLHYLGDEDEDELNYYTR